MTAGTAMTPPSRIRLISALPLRLSLDRAPIYKEYQQEQGFVVQVICWGGGERPQATPPTTLSLILFL